MLFCALGVKANSTFGALRDLGLLFGNDRHAVPQDILLLQLLDVLAHLTLDLFLLPIVVHL